MFVATNGSVAFRYPQYARVEDFGDSLDSFVIYGLAGMSVQFWIRDASRYPLTSEDVCANAEATYVKSLILAGDRIVDMCSFITEIGNAEKTEFFTVVPIDNPRLAQSTRYISFRAEGLSNSSTEQVLEQILSTLHFTPR